MGLFDVKCALSGLILQSGKTLLLPLVREGKKCVPIGLPIGGHYDGYGSLDPIDKDPVAEHFAKAFVERVKMGEPPKRGLAAFVKRISQTDAFPPKLGKRDIELAYGRASVYEVLIESGAQRQRDEKLADKLRGADLDALWELAFADKEARIFYENASEDLRAPLRAALIRFAESGLGHRAITPRKDADFQQASKKQLAASLAKARKAMANVPGIAVALDDYEAREIKGDNPDHIAVGPAALAKLANGKLDFKVVDGGAALEKTVGDERLRVEVKEGKEIVELYLQVSVGERSARQCIARIDVESDDEEVAEDVAHVEKAFDDNLEELRAMLGRVPLARMLEMAKASRWFLARMAADTNLGPDALAELALAMKKFPYTDDVRTAWIAILARADCPLAIAEALAGHTSKSVKDAAQARLARG